MSILLSSWGWVGHHKVVTGAAQSYPPSMQAFQVWTTAIASHASDADYRKSTDPNEAPRHYINLEAYSTFVLSGVIPSTIDSAILLYGSGNVHDWGILPWATLTTMDSIIGCMQRLDWDQALVFIADLAHYVGDGFMPLHLTLNYNGQLSGNTGIHSRYESFMINTYIDSLAYSGNTPSLLPDIQQYIYAYLYLNHTYRDSVLAADNYAKALFPDTTSTQYLEALWAYSRNFTTDLFSRCSFAFAELLYNAWSLAGYPALPSDEVFSSGFETWTAAKPDGWMGSKTSIENDSVLPYAIFPQEGNLAVQLINAETSHRRFTTQTISVLAGEAYTIAFWVKGKGSIRTGLYDGRSSNSGYAPYNAYLDIDQTIWSPRSQVVLAENTSPVAEFVLSARSSSGLKNHLQIDRVNVISHGWLKPGLCIVSPDNQAAIYGTEATVVLQVSNFIPGPPGSGMDGYIACQLDSAATFPHYSIDPLIISGLSLGPHQLVLQLVDNDGFPLLPPVTDTLHFSCVSLPIDFHSIYEIQFTTDPDGNSAFLNQLVSSAGIVTASYSSGYFIQSGSGAWCGIYVYDNQHPVSLGDSILLRGLVHEYYQMTELKSISFLQILSSGNALPEPMHLSCNAMNAEPYEGCLVRLDPVNCVNVNAGYGMWTVADPSGTAKVHNLLYTFTPALNTVYSITGPVYYSFNEYRVEPREEGDIQPSGFNLGSITGLLSYDNSAASPMPGQSIKLWQGSALVGETTTGLLGTYQLDSLPAGIYQLEIQCNMPWGGGNATDALLAMRHFVGQLTLTGLRLLAADVDASGFVNSVDALMIMRRFVNLINAFGAGDWQSLPVQVALSQNGQHVQDLKVLCTGDLDASWLP